MVLAGAADFSCLTPLCSPGRCGELQDEDEERGVGAGGPGGRAAVWDPTPGRR